MKKINCFLIITFLIITAIKTQGFSRFNPNEILTDNPQKDTIKHHIGELYGGGVIFYIDDTGQHGLICSMFDLRRGNFEKIGSKLVISQYNEIDARDAKIICDNYQNSNYGTGVFSDWYLPTINDLERLYGVKDRINKVLEECDKNLTSPLRGYYWSSYRDLSEFSLSYQNWVYNIDDGNRGYTTLKGIMSVRAIRKF
jgi:hypothetical protein